MIRLVTGFVTLATLVMDPIAVSSLIAAFSAGGEGGGSGGGDTSAMDPGRSYSPLLQLS